MGPRKRSETIAELVEEFLRRERRAEALSEFAGTMPIEDYPEWSTPEAAAAWVRDQRSRNRSLDRSSDDE